MKNVVTLSFGTSSKPRINSPYIKVVNANFSLSTSSRSEAFVNGPSIQTWITSKGTQKGLGAVLLQSIIQLIKYLDNLNCYLKVYKV